MKFNLKLNRFVRIRTYLILKNTVAQTITRTTPIKECRSKKKDTFYWFEIELAQNPDLNRLEHIWDKLRRAGW